MVKIEIINVKDQWVLGIKKIGRYSVIPELLKVLFDYTAGREIIAEGPAIFVCHEASKEEAEAANGREEAEVEVCIPVKGEVELDDKAKDLNIECYTLNGGEMVKTVHKGPYESSEPAINKLYEWIRANNKQIAGPLREHYLNNPKKVVEKDLLTEIWVPIE